MCLGPGSLHDLQCPGEAVRRDVGGGVQGPLEVRPGGEPGVEHEGRRGLPVPARADVGEPPDQARAPVLLLADEGQVREVSFLGGPDVVERTEHRQGKGCVARAFLRQRTMSTP